MSLLAVVKSDLPVLASDIRREHVACLESAGAAADHAWKAGTLLLEAKKQVTYGEWEAWLVQTGIKPRTAQVYMRLAKAQRAAPPEGVSIRSALRGLAALDPVPGGRRRFVVPAPAEEPADGPASALITPDLIRTALQIIRTGYLVTQGKHPTQANKDAFRWVARLIQRAATDIRSSAMDRK